MIGKLSSSPFSSCSKTHSSYPKMGINAHLNPCYVRFQIKNDNKRGKNENFVEIRQFEVLKRQSKWRFQIKKCSKASFNKSFGIYFLILGKNVIFYQQFL